MDFKDTLAKIDAALGPKTITFKSKTEAEAYVAEQLAKAKEETEEEDTKKGEAKARKRMTHLRANLETLSKASWDGQSNAITIPVYDMPGGFDNVDAELTQKEEKTPPAGNSGTQGAGAPIAGAGGAQSFGDAVSNGGGGGQGGTPKIGGTAGDGSSFAAPGGAQSFAKSLGDLNKALEGLSGKTPEAPKTQTQKNAPADDYTFPRDMAQPEYLKEGVAKRGVEWGTDVEKSKA